MDKQKTRKKSKNWQIWVSWIVTIFFVVLLVSVLFWQPILAQEMADRNGGDELVAAAQEFEETTVKIDKMPAFKAEQDESFISRVPETNTIMPTKPRTDPVIYEVEPGDAVFSIAKKYNITPETLLWSNYDVLQDDPHSLRVGQQLVIPPTDGILYEWQEGNNLQDVAGEFRASVDDILAWSGNRLDYTDPQVDPGTYVMIPGGEREFQQWVIPTYAVGRSGTNATLPGGCTVEGGGLWGSGFFIWPADNHYLSGNDFWSGHLAIDIAAGTGAPIYASDAGVVVFAGWDSNGYGNVVMIDHQNGYHTLYAHLSSFNVSCGSNAYQGMVIGYGGSTGNSTGPHLHFEIRYLGGFINPWTVLP